jgi:hypothetical protein
LALKFLLHFVGDMHQPLHAADDHDAGGNKKLVEAEGLHPGNLHHYWDIEFVERLGTDPRQVAASLVGQISEGQQQGSSNGTPADWAMEAFGLAREHAYGLLPQPNGEGTYSLPPTYIQQAVQDVPLQLSRAGVRLAFVLNKAFATTREAEHECDACLTASAPDPPDDDQLAGRGTNSATSILIC